MDQNYRAVESDDDEVLNAFQRAKELNLCPNRIWAVAGDNLPKLLPNCNLTPVSKGQLDDKENFSNHDECTSDFCEYSQRDFTAVGQRHECSLSEREHCKLTAMFPRNRLDSAAENEKSTVWSLRGNSLLDHPTRPYMAISHVWADGTGTGAWNAGEVNECLWEFFREIAKQFDCEGIWWDTLCVPSEKAARSKAIRKIHMNYEVARITLVHDEFLRSWPWDPETACFAILMSPWFSRGWTALELAKSPKVKVIFKGPRGPVFKDLDEEVLAKATTTSSKHSSSPRQEASRIIRNLRKDIDGLNDLLSVLSSRYTSWPKDIATISALLVDVARDEQQQDTYKNILKKLGHISPGHLFHNAATMTKEFSWCPAKLFDIPLDFSEPSLTISHNGDIEGDWRVIPVDPKTEKACWWDKTHSLIRRRLRSALKNPRWCRLLAEGQETDPISRALLVSETNQQNRFDYIGAVYFRNKISRKVKAERVTISGRRWSGDVLSEDHDPGRDGILEVRGGSIPANDAKKGNSYDNHDASGSLSLEDAIWRGYNKEFKRLSQTARLDMPNNSERPLLHLAAERANIQIVKDLLRQKVDLNKKCPHRQTALHCAAWTGSLEVVEELVRNNIDTSVKDKDGNTALHIAAKMGFAPIVKLLITKTNVNSGGCNGLSPLHLAAMYGHTSLVELLEHADLNVKDAVFGWTPLHFAVDHGDPKPVKLLIHRGADVDAKDEQVGWTPLHMAAMSGHGHREVVEILLEKCADIKSQDNFGWTPRHFAELNGHAQISQVLYHAGIKDGNTVSEIQDCWTSLHCKAIHDGRGITRSLFESEVDFYLTEHSNTRIPRRFSVEKCLGTAIRSLLNQSAKAMADNGQTKAYNNEERWKRLETAFVEARGSEITSPMPYLPFDGDDRAFTWLLIQRSVPNDRDEDGSPSLHVAARSGHVALVWLLLLKGADTEDKDAMEMTPLLHICLPLPGRRAPNIDSEAIRFLLQRDHDADTTSTLTGAQGRSNQTPSLHCYHDEIEAKMTIAKLLLERNSDHDARNTMFGMTPLHLAALHYSKLPDDHFFEYPTASEIREYVAFMKLLLSKGADKEARDIDGNTPLDLAIARGNELAIQLLRAAA